MTSGPALPTTTGWLEGAGISPHEELGASSPTPPPFKRVRAPLCCPDKVQGLLFLVLQLKGEGQLPCQLQEVGARGEGIFPSFPPSLQTREVVPAMPLYTLRASSPVPLSTGSSLLRCPGEAQGPFSQVLQLVRGWVRSPTCHGRRGVRGGGHLSLTHTIIWQTRRSQPTLPFSWP